MSESGTTAFGERLRQWRLAAGLSQEALAERAGLSSDAVAALERGRRTSPRPSTVALLAEALGLAPAERTALLAAARQHGPPALAPPVAGLPSPLTPLVGRERELALVLDLLDPAMARARLVTLTGPGGVGKTRLALEIAARLEGEYRDGVAFIDLASVREEHLVAASIARDLGLREEGAQSARGLLLGSLRTRGTLLVLDNFEQVRGAAPLLGDLVAACPRLAILVTSRAPLRLRLEQRVPLAGLATPPEASATRLADVLSAPAPWLFVERARAVTPEFVVDEDNAAVVAAICRRLDGLPLAIELAAARCAVLPPTSLLARLDQPLPLLTGGPIDLPARQQTLRATLEWSEALLSRPVQSVFRRLAVFDGGCALEAVDAILAPLVGSHDELDSLQTLLDHSLLTRTVNPGGQLRFALLETVREYAAERLEALGEALPTRAAHASYYLRLAETARSRMFGSDQLAWLVLLDQEHANLRAALAHLIGAGDVERSLRLVGALWRFWYIRCYFGEGRQRLESALASAPDAETRREAIDAYVGLAVIAYAQTDYRRAQEAATRGAALARAAGVEADLAILLNILAGVARNRNEYERAVSLGEECVTLARRLDDRWMLALSLHNLADVARIQGAYDRADALAAQSLDLAQEVNDRWGILQAQTVRGWTAHDRGDLAAAAETFARCLEIARDLGHTRNTAQALAGLAKVALVQHDLARAAALLDESVALWRLLGDTIRLAQVLVMQGHLARARGDRQAAGHHFQQALRLFAAADARLGVAESLEALAIDSVAAPEVAVRLAAFAAGIREAIGAPIEPVELLPLEQHLAAVRGSLGERTYQAAWEHGRTLSLQEAIDEALVARS